MPGGGARKGKRAWLSVKAEAAFSIRTVRQVKLWEKEARRKAAEQGSSYFSRSSGVTERCSREARSTACSTTYSALASKR